LPNSPGTGVPALAHTARGGAGIPIGIPECARRPDARIDTFLLQRILSTLVLNVVCCETAIRLERGQSGRARRALKPPLRPGAGIAKLAANIRLPPLPGMTGTLT